MSIASYITGLQHIGIPSDRLSFSVSFYEKLGFQKIYETVNHAAREQSVIFMEFGTLILELYEEENIAGKTGSINHIALNCTDIEQTYAACLAAGLPFHENHITPLPYWTKGIRYFSVKGPSQEIIEFCEKL